MKSLKGYSAWEANRCIGRKGAFWQLESYDRVVRDNAEFARIVKYVLNNPVKASLVREWREWKWNYRREPFRRLSNLRRFRRSKFGRY